MIVHGDIQLHNLPEFQINLGLLQEFERGLDPRSPENSRIPARVLGYGKISTVLEIQAEECRGLAFKRLAIFETTAEIERYLATYVEYMRLLEDEIGVRLPPHGYAAFPNPGGRPVFYIVQKKLPAAAIGSKALAVLPPETAPRLVRRVLRELRKVWDYNGRQNRLRFAIDGQLSKWAIEVFGVGGGEAVDLAIKLARGHTGRPKVISARGGYHGHTGLALAAGESSTGAHLGHPRLDSSRCPSATWRPWVPSWTTTQRRSFSRPSLPRWAWCCRPMTSIWPIFSARALVSCAKSTLRFYSE